MNTMVDKIIVTAGAATTAVSTGKSVGKSDSLVKGLLDSSLNNIIDGNFILYGSDVLALASLTATLALLAWRIFFDIKESKQNKAQ